jgi:hypothetical protein
MVRLVAIGFVAAGLLGGSMAVSSTPARADGLSVDLSARYHYRHYYRYHHRFHHRRFCRITVRRGWRHGHRVVVRRRICF